MSRQKMVTIGGGTGHSLLLKALIRLAEFVLTAVVPVSDSGRSTGRLREECGTSGCIGDLMRCILALTPLGGFEELLNLRLQGGALHDHAARNLMFVPLEQQFGLFEAAVRMGEIFQLCPHRVLPVSPVTATLMAKIGAKIIEGEHAIACEVDNLSWDPILNPISHVWLKEFVRVAERVAEAISNANWITVAPGDLMTSILAVLAAAGMREAIAESSAHICVVMNIMTRHGETDGFAAPDFLRWIETALGRKANVVLCNDGASIPMSILDRYREEHKSVLVAPDHHDPRFVIAPLWMQDNEGVICHSPEKLFFALRDTCLI